MCWTRKHNCRCQVVQGKDVHSMIPHAQGFEERHVLVGCCAMQAVRRLRQSSADTAVRRTALKTVGEEGKIHSSTLPTSEGVLLLQRATLQCVLQVCGARFCACISGGCPELSVKRTPTSWPETGQSGVSILFTLFLLYRGSCTC